MKGTPRLTASVVRYLNLYIVALDIAGTDEHAPLPTIAETLHPEIIPARGSLRTLARRMGAALADRDAWGHGLPPLVARHLERRLGAS
jgi:hypothetical protein